MSNNGLRRLRQGMDLSPENAKTVLKNMERQQLAEAKMQRNMLNEAAAVRRAKVAAAEAARAAAKAKENAAKAEANAAKANVAANVAVNIAKGGKRHTHRKRRTHCKRKHTRRH